MQQRQVNNTANTSSTMDCRESRTVRTHNERKTQRQSRRAACIRSSKVDAHSSNVTTTAVTRPSDATRLANCNGNCQTSTATASTVCASAAVRSPMQSALLSTRSTNLRPQMKQVALLPIICLAILAHISTASGRTLHGRKLILHTHESRMQRHNDLIHYEREIEPKHTAPAHHERQRHIRSPTMSCDQEKNIVADLRKQSMTSFRNLYDGVNNYALNRFNETAMHSLRHWRETQLNLSHPLQKDFDRNFLDEVGNHNFSHLLKDPQNNEMLKVELKKIYTTIKTLNLVITRLCNNTTKNREEKRIMFKDIDDMILFLDNLKNDATAVLRNTMEALTALHIEIEKFDEESVTYNPTHPVNDWLIIREHMSFLKYVNQLYGILMTMCTAT